ncbi:Glutamate receptor ionotropic, NMDA 2B [Orchesella cincta]|uniref:Glutamate receptor ionotropic, NMDA 2B n=1 Tax=Orchesella cincta TaxID=48709 RepID=A0A1D2NBX6_ORCCI|nr:Glutamate receptor ionotropic, NMDA 2B [Orchesella cincta]
MILPHSIFHRKDYLKSINVALTNFKPKNGTEEMFSRFFNLDPLKHVLVRLITISPSPQDILSTLCEAFLTSNVSAIIYLTNIEKYTTSTAASQYFLQLAGYLGLPVIAWNADNSGFQRRATSSSDYNSEMVLQMAPAIHHQAAAMLSILTRYNWHQFAIVTSQIAGHDDFVQAVRDKVVESQFKFKFVELANVLVVTEQDLFPLVDSEARILLLYCTKEEAKWIMRAATLFGLTGAKYVWIVTQSVIGDSLTLTDVSYQEKESQELPVGMLGVHFNTTIEALKAEISNSLRVFANGVLDFRNDARNHRITLTPNVSCDGQGEYAKWREGDHFYRALRNVTIEYPDVSRPPLRFNPDGTIMNVELQIMNLRPTSGISEKNLAWEQVETVLFRFFSIFNTLNRAVLGLQIGSWHSWKKDDEDTQLDIKDIIWPGKSHKPPDGVPEKFHLKITFLEEAPYIRMTDPDPITGRCSPDRGSLCRINNNSQVDYQHGPQSRSSNNTVENLAFLSNCTNCRCCSGFNIDLLVKFAEDIGFTYDLIRVADSKWGTYVGHKWNGLIGELINRKADVALASLMINSEREAVVDFSVPFMDSGIAIMTAKRTGIISPTAFLEPFDASLWFLVCVVGIQVYSLFIFLFEWLSPLGFDMKKYPSPGSRFSFFRSCWLVWARLFQASVHVDPPRGFTAKFVVHVWSMFAVVFLATYTANLAVFMITREETHQFVGIHDQRLSNPMSIKPSMKFATVMNTHTGSLLAKHHPDMFVHMKQFNVATVSEGVNAVRRQELDAFIYDGPVLQYEVLQDTSETCKLLIEGSWYAHTGYGIAFPRNSKYLPLFNKLLMEYKENGDLERLRRYYFTGPCAAEQGRQSQPTTTVAKFNTFGTGPLALEQFLSVFLLLGIGVLVGTVFVFCERAYANCIVSRVFDNSDQSQKKPVNVAENKNKKPPPACLQLLSQNMGLPYSRTFYRAHKRDSNIKLLDHITSSFTIYDNPTTQHTITDYYHGFLESFVLRKMITCNDPICQRNFVKLENELKKCLIRLRQIENWGRLYDLNEIGRRSTIKQSSNALMRTRISTIERNHDEIVGKRICGDYSDYSIFSGTAGGVAVVSAAGERNRVFRDQVIGGKNNDNEEIGNQIIKVAEIETVL